MREGNVNASFNIYGAKDLVKQELNNCNKVEIKLNYTFPKQLKEVN
jgi:hypothetical protein